MMVGYCASGMHIFPLPPPRPVFIIIIIYIPIYLRKNQNAVGGSKREEKSSQKLELLACRSAKRMSSEIQGVLNPLHGSQNPMIEIKLLVVKLR